MTIRKKLTLLYGGLLAVAVIVFGVAVLSMVRWTMLNTIDSALEETASYIIANSNAYPYRRELGGPVVIGVDLPPLDIFRASNVVVQVWRSTEAGMEFGRGSANLGGYRDPLDTGSLGQESAVLHSVGIGGTQWRVLTRPILVQGRLWGNVQVAASLQTINETTSRLLGIMGIISGLAILIMGALSLWFSHRALKPISDITKAAASIAAAEDLATRMEWKGPMDELGRMVSVINHMMERLEQLFSVQQRFVADVSHELRTPLTAIRGNLEIVNRYGADAESLEAINDEVDRMARMVDDLLLLARADYGGLTIDLYPVDLDTILSEVYQQARMLAKDRDLSIRIGAFEPVRINGNPDRLRQLIINLVSNAIKFTPDGGTITLGLRRQDGQAIISVQDTGIGIQPDHLAHIFERFYQVDPSRTHVDLHGGAGLGLSIARWIADAHGATIRVDSAPGEGSTFSVWIPLTPSDDSPAPEDRSFLTRLPRIGRSRAPEHELG